MAAREKTCQGGSFAYLTSHLSNNLSSFSPPVNMKYALRHLRVWLGWGHGGCSFHLPSSLFPRGACVLYLSCPSECLPPACPPHAQMCAASRPRRRSLLTALLSLRCGRPPVAAAALACNRQHLCASIHPSIHLPDSSRVGTRCACACLCFVWYTAVCVTGVRQTITPRVLKCGENWQGPTLRLPNMCVVANPICHDPGHWNLEGILILHHHRGKMHELFVARGSCM